MSEPIRNHDYILPFGKYRGERLGDVIVEDPQYLMWAHNDTEYVPWFELHADVVDEIEGTDKDWQRYKS